MAYAKLCKSFYPSSILGDKYTTEQIIAELDRILGGVVQNYRGGLKTGRPEFLWSSLGDLVKMKDILHEMKTRNDEREALKKM